MEETLKETLNVFVKEVATAKLLSSVINLWDESPKDPNNVALELELDNQKYTSEGPDYFTALQQLRLKLEHLGMIVCCVGAERDVFPSPMQQSMGVGRTAYRTTIGKQALKSDIVEIFSPAEPKKCVSVAEQEMFHRQWISSVLGE